MVRRDDIGRHRAVLLLIAAVAIAGCSTSTTTGNLVDPQGSHPAGWRESHPSFALPDGSACIPCHGSVTAADSGGISKVSCFSASFNGQSCHPGGPAMHPADWRVTHGPSARPDGSACTACHGAVLEGGSGPACGLCHKAASPATSPAGCVSCHGNPPPGSPPMSLTGYPNVAGSHGKHDNLAPVTGVCDSCHVGGGSGRMTHFNGVVDVAFRAVYAAKTGGPPALVAPDNTCAGISCHGGQPTPAWGQAGAIVVADNCSMCHRSRTVSDQYNSYHSGNDPGEGNLHDLHVAALALAPFNANPPCKGCHDATSPDKLRAVHFATLDTQAMEGAGSTLNANIVYDPAQRTCAPACHLGDTRAWPP